MAVHCFGTYIGIVETEILIILCFGLTAALATFVGVTGNEKTDFAVLCRSAVISNGVFTFAPMQAESVLFSYINACARKMFRGIKKNFMTLQARHEKSKKTVSS